MGSLQDYFGQGLGTREFTDGAQRAVYEDDDGRQFVIDALERKRTAEGECFAAGARGHGEAPCNRALRDEIAQLAIAREPATVRMGEVLRALEGPIAPMICATDDPGAEKRTAFSTSTRRRAASSGQAPRR